MTPTARLYLFPTPSEREGRQSRARRRSPLRDSAASRKRGAAVSFPALKWAWDQSARGVKQHVLLALANRVNPKTQLCCPSMADLSTLTGLSERTIRRAVSDLIADGLVEIGNAGPDGKARGGRRIHTRYALLMDSERRPQSPPFEHEEVPETRPNLPSGEPETRPNLHEKVATQSTPVLRTRTSKGQPGTDGAATATPTPTETDFADDDGGMFEKPVTEASQKRDRNKIAGAITARYQAVVPLSNRPAVHKVVEKALRFDYSGEQVMAALLRIAADNRAITTDTLRIEIEGFGKPRPNGRRNGTDFDALQAQFSGGAA